eukprot:1160595-Pelagomonas_calceolata.AAC.7
MCIKISKQTCERLVMDLGIDSARFTAQLAMLNLAPDVLWVMFMALHVHDHIPSSLDCFQRLKTAAPQSGGSDEHFPDAHLCLPIATMQAALQQAASCSGCDTPSPAAFVPGSSPWSPSPPGSSTPAPSTHQGAKSGGSKGKRTGQQKGGPLLASALAAAAESSASASSATAAGSSQKGPAASFGTGSEAVGAAVRKPGHERVGRGRVGAQKQAAAEAAAAAAASPLSSSAPAAFGTASKGSRRAVAVIAAGQGALDTRESGRSNAKSTAKQGQEQQQQQLRQPQQQGQNDGAGKYCRFPEYLPQEQLQIMFKRGLAFRGRFRVSPAGESVSAGCVAQQSPKTPCYTGGSSLVIKVKFNCQVLPQILHRLPVLPQALCIPASVPESGMSMLETGMRLTSPSPDCHTTACSGGSARRTGGSPRRTGDAAAGVQLHRQACMPMGECTKSRAAAVVFVVVVVVGAGGGAAAVVILTSVCAEKRGHLACQLRCSMHSDQAACRESSLCAIEACHAWFGEACMTAGPCGTCSWQQMSCMT